jgi:hypothetical protein
MRRREFVVGLGGAAAAWPLAARAQQPGGVRRVGVLMNTVATDAKFQSYVAVFIQGLRQLGWVEGHNLRVDVRRSLERRANISGTSLPTSPQAPRKPGSAGVDAPLSPNELLQWLRIRLVRRRVPHHLRPLAPRPFVGLGRVGGAPNDGGEGVLLQSALRRRLSDRRPPPSGQIQERLSRL